MLFVTKAIASDSYIARLTGRNLTSRALQLSEVAVDWQGSMVLQAIMRPSIERANEQLDPRQQLANTPSPQSTTPGLHPVSIHQMVPPKRTSSCSN